MSPTMTLITADQYLAQGETDERMELIEGEIVVMNTPREDHQNITVNLVMELRAWTRAAPGRGYASIELDQRLDDRNVYAPDVWWVREGRRPDKSQSHRIGPPDLAVEIRSDSTWRYDVGTKKRVYERSGLPELWLIDTKADSVLVYRRTTQGTAEFDVALELQRGDILTSPQLDGFSVAVSDLFDR